MMWSLLWRIGVSVGLCAIVVEGVGGAMWLLNYPDDLFVFAGILVLIGAILVPLWIGVKVLPWRSRKQTI